MLVVTCQLQLQKVKSVILSCVIYMEIMVPISAPFLVLGMKRLHWPVLYLSGD